MFVFGLWVAAGPPTLNGVTCATRTRPNFTRILLTAWMAVVSLGVSITHAHAPHGEFHTHGFGWNGPHCPACDTPKHEHDEPSASHTHFILLGFELPGEAAPPDASPVQSVIAHEADSADDGDTTAAERWMCQHQPDRTAALHTPAEIGSARPLPTFRPVVRLSAVAARAVAGVLRT